MWGLINILVYIARLSGSPQAVKTLNEEIINMTVGETVFRDVEKYIVTFRIEGKLYITSYQKGKLTPCRAGDRKIKEEHESGEN